MPNLVLPPLNIASTFPLKSCLRCSESVELGLVEIFALGAAIGTPLLLMRAIANSQSGILMPTLSKPALATVLIASEAGRITVSGPGHNFDNDSKIPYT